MSFTSYSKIYIGLFVAVGMLLCLLGIYGLHRGMSDRTSGTVASNTAPVPESPTATSTVAGMTFEIVTSEAAQERGLGGRKDIPIDYGMLFVFPTDGAYGFWMKDMLAPIDMVWLSSAGVITKIDAAVSPSTYPNVFYPPSPVRYVLETRAGFAAQKGWVVGTKIPLPAGVLQSQK